MNIAVTMIDIYVNIALFQITKFINDSNEITQRQECTRSQHKEQHAIHLNIHYLSYI